MIFMRKGCETCFSHIRCQRLNHVPCHCRDDRWPDAVRSTLTSATNVLETVLTTAVSATAVVDADAGNAMLGSLLTIATANTEGGGDTSESAAVTAPWA